MIRKYIATARMAAYEKTNGGLLYLLPDIFMKVVYLVPVMFIWKSLAGRGYEVPFTAHELHLCQCSSDRHDDCGDLSVRMELRYQECGNVYPPHACVRPGDCKDSGGVGAHAGFLLAPHVSGGPGF